MSMPTPDTPLSVRVYPPVLVIVTAALGLTIWISPQLRFPPIVWLPVELPVVHWAISPDPGCTPPVQSPLVLRFPAVLFLVTVLPVAVDRTLNKSAAARAPMLLRRLSRGVNVR